MTRDEMLDKREDVLGEFDDRVDPSHGVMTLAETRWFTAQLLADEIVRLRAILAKLREPSREMREAVHDALNARKVTDPIIGEDIDEIIEAAVAAAEKEVQGE